MARVEVNSISPLPRVGRARCLPVRVAHRAVSNGKAEIRLADGECLQLHRFALVGKNDSVVRGPSGQVLVALPGKGGYVQVLPTWRMQQHISVLGRCLQVVVKEIETEEELAGYEALIQHHYRTGAGTARRAPLIAKVKLPDLPEVIGFVEVTSCFLANGARRKILDAPFSDAEHGVSWDRWDMDATKKYTNVVARISRCVVYPELRGVGVAGILAEAAKNFAINRWHIGGWRPVFMEITAEMLRYWPFVEKVGFVKVGDTEGNGKCLEQQQRYLLQRQQENRGFPGGTGGIMSMHKSNLLLIQRVMKEKGMCIEDVIRLIKKTPEKLSVADWVDLHGIYRRPKPVYMLGLKDSAHEHLQKRLLEINAPATTKQTSCTARKGVSLRDFHLSVSCAPDSSRESRRIQEAFSIVSKRQTVDLVSSLTLEISPGEIVLVGGASGSGKSLLLQALAWHVSGGRRKWSLPQGARSKCASSQPIKVGMMGRPNPHKTPIALLERFGIELEEAMRLLAAAGLGEAQLFVRPSGTLSSGQRYRLAMALALAQKPDLLLIDEFCEPLDDYATTAVCQRLRKEAKRSGLAVVVATANSARVIPDLRPERLLRLLPDRQHRWEKRP